MALKKSPLYGSLWSSCDELRGGMDASQYQDQINKKMIAPLADANKLSEFPDFNDAAKLGSGKEMVDRITNLVAIFENPALDFSTNRADGDDILGDAYEYLMRHFATESGKSKGQFYTPAEVIRVALALTLSNLFPTGSHRGDCSFASSGLCTDGASDGRAHYGPS